MGNITLYLEGKVMETEGRISFSSLRYLASMYNDEHDCRLKADELKQVINRTYALALSMQNQGLGEDMAELNESDINKNIQY